jgi:hypothetical protein
MKKRYIGPFRMFKYLLLTPIYDLLDVDVVERSKFDMPFKYFLHGIGYAFIESIKRSKPFGLAYQ